MKTIILDIETTGLNPWFGDRITAIGARASNGIEFIKSDKDEEYLLKDFYTFLSAYSDYTLITKNGNGFDIPFLLTRASRGNGYIFDNLRVLLTTMNHIDIQLVTQKRISLEEFATILNCKKKTGTGLQAISLFNEGKIDELITYLDGDLDTTEEVFNKLVELGTIAEIKINT